jgi:biotin operon repressor
MGIKALNWALEVQGIKSGQKLVLLVLANWANDITGQCWPCVETVAEKCCLSRASVIENIQKLIELGLAASQKQHDTRGYRRANLYSLNLHLSPDFLLRKNESQSPENLRRDFECQSPESECAKVQNLDGNIINPKKEPLLEPKDKRSTEEKIFDYWKITMGHPNAKFDPKRKQRIKTALGYGYTLEQLCEAITGCSLTPHNMGHNDRNERYDSIELILRDGAHIDRFIYNAKNPPKFPQAANGDNYANPRTGFSSVRPPSASVGYDKAMRVIRGSPEQYLPEGATISIPTSTPN